MSSDYVLLVLLLGIVGVIICSSLALHARHKQRMLILKTGIKPEEKPHRRERLLIGGSSMIGIGLGLLLGLSTKTVGVTSGFILLFVGTAVTLVALFSVKKSTPSSQQIIQRRETMRALLHRLNEFKEIHPHVVITLIAGSSLTGEIQKIIDDELLKFKEDLQQEVTYIPIDKIISIRKAEKEEEKKKE